MPKRPDMAVMPRKGKSDETLYSPSAALRFIKEVLGHSLGESTMRLWRRNGKGPTWYRDTEGNLWYKERALRTYYAGRETDRDPLAEAEQKANPLEINSLRENAPAPIPGVKSHLDGNGFLSRPKLNTPKRPPALRVPSRTQPHRLQVSA